MRYLLDTAICVYLAKRGPATQLQHLKLLTAGEVGMSIITYGELRFAAQSSKLPVRAQDLLAEFAEVVPVLSLEAGVAARYAQLRFDLQQLGRTIGNNDLWIAAHCLHLGLTLITNDDREFSHVPHLKIDHWVV